MEKLRRLVDTSSFPLRGLDASMNEVDSSAKDYVLAVMRTTLVPDRLGVADADSLDGGATAPFRGGPAIERFDGDGSFTREDCHRIVLAYEKQFNKSLPVSAHGDTALHRALGYNHRNRMDVALFPDAVEGVWLRRYLKANDISYYAFRGYVPGKATAAHIHVGPPSSRLLRTN